MYETKEIVKSVISLLDNKKVEDMVVINIAEVLPIADYFIIATVNSVPQVRGVIMELEKELRKFGLKHINRNILSQNNWFLLDFNTVIIHLFTPDARSYYQLENLWKKNVVSLDEFTSNIQK